MNNFLIGLIVFSFIIPIIPLGIWIIYFLCKAFVGLSQGERNYYRRRAHYFHKTYGI